MTLTMTAAVAALALLAQDPLGNTSGGALLDEQAAFDVLHYDLALDVDPDAQAISGTLIMTARVVAPAREIVLHLDQSLQVSGVSGGVAAATDAAPEERAADLRTAKFRHEDGLIWIDSASFAAERGATFRVAVDYGGKPRVAQRPPWEGGFTWQTTESGAHWIATSCQGEGADLWWPCKDHPSDKPDAFDLSFTVPEGLVVATNGRHLESVTEKGRTTSRWRVTTPIANYTVALNVAPYVELTRTMQSVAGDEIPIHFWVLPENEEKGKAFLDEIVDHLRFFEETCGPYPFRGDKYGVVETPHLGMEHQSIIAYGNRYNGDPNFDYDWLHHHELAHEWWANLVTARDWADFWIHEGIGTYMQPLYLERKFGRDAYDKKMQIDLLRVLNNAPMVPKPPRTTDSIYFSQDGGDAPGGDIYFKGSWVCHSLRWLLGDEKFFPVLRRWAYPDPELEATTDGSAVRFADTDELIRIAEEVTGDDLKWFFEVYVRRAALPELVTRNEGGVLYLEWKAPDDLPFPMPIEVVIDGTARRIPMADGKTSFEVGEAEVEIDPGHKLLRELRR